MSGMTLEEVAAELGVTRQRVQQIEKKALGKLRRALARQGLRFEDLTTGTTSVRVSVFDVADD